jgi:hypothetical protein
MAYRLANVANGYVAAAGRYEKLAWRENTMKYHYREMA